MLKTEDRITISISKEYHSYLEGVASTSYGMSLDEFIMQAIEEKAERRDGEDIPNDLISKAKAWLKNKGMTDEDINDFIMYLGE